MGGRAVPPSGDSPRGPGAAAPGTNNPIEGGVDARPRAMLRDHRGMSLGRRAKAVLWRCHARSPGPSPAAEPLRTAPADGVAAAYLAMGGQGRLTGTIPGWGDAAVWARLHPEETGRNPWD